MSLAVSPSANLFCSVLLQYHVKIYMLVTVYAVMLMCSCDHTASFTFVYESFRKQEDQPTITEQGQISVDKQQLQIISRLVEGIFSNCFLSQMQKEFEYQSSLTVDRSISSRKTKYYALWHGLSYKSNYQAYYCPVASHRTKHSIHSPTNVSIEPGTELSVIPFLL